jgi:DASS family divalent anion:Na+ symporter
MLRWAVVLGVGVVLGLWPAPVGVAPASWTLFAVFASVIVGLAAPPAPAGFVVLLGIIALPLLGVMPIQKALTGYADPIVWMVLAAFMMSRGMIKTGLGRRIAYLFIRAIGGRSLGLGYALVGTDLVLASFIPSNAARTGGIVYPIARSLAQAYGSEPGPSARRLGSFLMLLLYQCECVVCAIFLTGQASNPLIARFAAPGVGELSYLRWLVGALLPGAVSIAIVPLILHRLHPPEVTHTPEASKLAAAELATMGPMKRGERFMLAVFALVAGLWTTVALHGIHYSLVALLGVVALVLTRVLDWEDLLSEREAWGVFLWYGGVVRLAEALSETGLTARFAGACAGFVAVWPWAAVLAVLLIIYFFAHYGFASITSHSTAMYTPFLAVMMAAGAPGAVAALLLAYFSNLSACLTHYGTTPGPILFGSGYTSQRAWWLLGLVCAVSHLLVWGTLGPLWWRLLGWW